MRLIAALVAIVFSQSALAVCDNWTRTDTAMLGGALALQAIDWNQTRKVTSEYQTQMDDFGTTQSFRSRKELNVLLGSEPSVAEINRYFIMTMTGTVAISCLLPTNWRQMFLGGVIFVQASVVLRNQRVGLKFEF